MPRDDDATMTCRTEDRTGLRVRGSIPFILVVLVSAWGVAACGSNPAVGGEGGPDRDAERIQAFASEARRLLQETADAGGRLAEQPQPGSEVRARLRTLAREARDLRGRIRRQDADARESRSLLAAVELIERGAEELLVFARTGRGDWLMTARDALTEAGELLDGVESRLDDDGREAG